MMAGRWQQSVPAGLAAVVVVVTMLLSGGGTRTMAQAPPREAGGGDAAATTGQGAGGGGAAGRQGSKPPVAKPSQVPGKLSSDIYSADTLSNAQVQTLKQYAAFWGRVLKGQISLPSEQTSSSGQNAGGTAGSGGGAAANSGSGGQAAADAGGSTQGSAAHGSASEPPAEDIVAARTRLLQPFGFNGSAAFENAYAAAVSRALQGALASNRVVVRLNTMIVASHLPVNSSVLGLVRQASQDKSPAVRYWAVKAMGQSSKAGPQTQQEILQLLNQLLSQEQSTQVLDQVYRAMVGLNLPGNGGLNRVIQALNRRAQAHVGKPKLPFRAETAGLRAAYQALLTAASSNPGQLIEPFRQIGRAAAQYMFVAAQNGRKAGQALTADLRADYTRMIKLDYQILQEVHDRLNAGVSMPGITSDINSKPPNWSGLIVAAQRVRDMLTSPPINLKPADVNPTAGNGGGGGGAGG